MRSDRGSWGRVISGGLIFGAAAVFVSLVGMVEALGVRVIVIGVIDFGRLLLLLIGLGAGYQAARRGGGGVRTALLRGPLAGAVVGVLGAAATLLPGTVRGPLGAGVTATIVIGLFQELLQIILQGEEGVRAAIRQLIFVPEGLPPRGALEVFVVVLVASALWRSRRPVVRGWISKRPPRTQRLLRLLGLLLAVAVVLVLPAAGGLFVSQVLVLVGLYTLMGLGLNLEVGFAGLLDF